MRDLLLNELGLRTHVCLESMSLLEEFVLENAVRRFHVNKYTWAAAVGEELTAERERSTAQGNN